LSAVDRSALGRYSDADARSRVLAPTLSGSVDTVIAMKLNMSIDIDVEDANPDVEEATLAS
jgi:hypothetical protein